MHASNRFGPPALLNPSLVLSAPTRVAQALPTQPASQRTIEWTYPGTSGGLEGRGRRKRTASHCASSPTVCPSGRARDPRPSADLLLGEGDPDFDQRPAQPRARSG